MKTNPFLLSGYLSPIYFCNRYLELNRIKDSVTNNRNLTLISPRRMGKTGLINHSFHSLLENNSIITVYFDVLGTTDLKEFVEVFSNAIIQSLAKTMGALRKLLKQLFQLRPSLSFNALTGEPKISLNIINGQEAVSSLEAIFELIRSRDNQFIIAVDEFQQITEYPEKNVEAILRSHIQQLNNACFIFSGSKNHVLADMFSGPSRPFFSSTEIMYLNPIAEKDYRTFIHKHFSAAGKEIQEDALDIIVKTTDLHTFYVQFLCNRLYSVSKKINAQQVEKTLQTILLENEPIYSNYLNLLTTSQYKTLRAISIEGAVKNPFSKKFLASHSLGALSSVKQAIDSLIEKEFLMREKDILIPQDKFLKEWIRMKSF